MISVRSPQPDWPQSEPLLTLAAPGPASASVRIQAYAGNGFERNGAALLEDKFEDADDQTEHVHGSVQHVGG